MNSPNHCSAAEALLKAALPFVRYSRNAPNSADFLGRQPDGDFLRFELFGKRRSKGLLVDFVLEAADTNLGQVRLGLVVHLHIHLEPDRIEQFQQAREADRLAVVGSGRGEDAMLEEEANLPQHLGALARTGAALGREVVALIDDQQVPRGMGQLAMAAGFGIGANP